MKGGVKSRRVRGICRMIQAKVSKKMLVVEVETSKAKNASTEVLRGLDQRMEKRDGGLQVHCNDPRYLSESREKKTMDFIPKLPRSSSRYDVIWAIVDRLAKSAYFLTDDQSDRTFWTLENMFRACVRNLVVVGILTFREMSFTTKIVIIRVFDVFSLEALYGRKCRLHVLWAEIGKSSLIRPKLVLETTDKVDEEVATMDGVFEGAFGALGLEIEALVDAMEDPIDDIVNAIIKMRVMFHDVLKMTSQEHAIRKNLIRSENDILDFNGAVQLDTFQLKKLISMVRSRKIGMIWSLSLLGICKRCKIPFIREDDLTIIWDYENLTELYK
uniref:Retrotransposon protein, putative, Ty3-gypsy subclass n=1 Tax=Tanacetum cinerariifolium TaxID=118510 RepID=A0A6L2L2X9_TANCI|nr:retrotransposon protein, putative, Ty3-gypsy subclass [Tanacetum cinerariifolium]